MKHNNVTLKKIDLRKTTQDCYDEIKKYIISADELDCEDNCYNEKLSEYLANIDYLRSFIVLINKYTGETVKLDESRIDEFKQMLNKFNVGCDYQLIKRRR